MLETLTVLHHAKVDGKTVPEVGGPASFRWETCLRQIVVSVGARGAIPATAEQNFPGWEPHTGEAGYCFLLEVICGLHSPVLGETEVLGQFRSQAETYLKVARGAEAESFQKLLQLLYRDAKSVRERFLLGAGRQSYGAVTRRWLRGCAGAHIVGAGQLVGDLLPWVHGSVRAISLYARRPEAAREFAEKFPSLNIAALEALAAYPRGSGNQALLVAAPLAATALAALARNFTADDLLLDFRADSHTDTLAFPGRSVTLPEIFHEIAARTEASATVLGEAKAAIAELARRMRDRIEHRPFGWEDVCA